MSTTTNLTNGVDTLDVPVDVKRILIEQDMQLWRNTRYQCEIRMRVQKRIGSVEGEAAMIAELERCEKALDVLTEELQSHTE